MPQAAQESREGFTGDVYLAPGATCEAHQLRHCCQVPVGVADVSVPEVGRQLACAAHMTSAGTAGMVSTPTMTQVSKRGHDRDDLPGHEVRYGETDGRRCLPQCSSPAVHCLVNEEAARSWSG